MNFEYLTVALICVYLGKNQYANDYSGTGRSITTGIFLKSLVSNGLAFLAHLLGEKTIGTLTSYWNRVCTTRFESN